MTPAAVYYHFAGKEQILLDGVRSFSDEFLAVARREVESAITIDVVISNLLEHIRKQRTSAVVFFVNSAGLNLALEAHRNAVRAELVELFTVAVKRDQTKTSMAEAGVMGATLVSLLDVSATSLLGRDVAYRGIGSRRFADSVTVLTRRIVGSVDR